MINWIGCKIQRCCLCKIPALSEPNTIKSDHFIGNIQKGRDEYEESKFFKRLKWRNAQLISAFDWPTRVCTVYIWLHILCDFSASLQQSKWSHLLWRLCHITKAAFVLFLKKSCCGVANVCQFKGMNGLRLFPNRFTISHISYTIKHGAF